MIPGLVAAALVAAGILVGSRFMAHFDPALYWYAVGSVLAAFAVAYRFAVWAQRPPSRMYFKRAWMILRSRGFGALRSGSSKSSREVAEFPAPSSPTSVATLGGAVAANFVGQTFVKRRSIYRWVMHLCLSGGCTLAFAVTFPLVFGWVHFESLPDDAETYRVMVMGLPVDKFSVHSVQAFVLFNMLNIAGVFVIIGVVMAAWRRITDAGVKAVQTFAEDILPLILIFAVTVTGLMLTVSYKFLGGAGHQFMAVVHMFTVLGLLFYIPFGKLFHMFQRTCSLCVSLYMKEGEHGERAHCKVCREDYTSAMHVEDLKTVLDQLGFNYRFSTPRGEVHYQDICPACRRRLLALNQGGTIGR